MTEDTKEQPAIVEGPLPPGCHTPGPWYVRQLKGPGHITTEVCYGEDDECITDGVYEISDAVLIASAPDLLVILKRMIWLVETEHGVDVGHILKDDILKDAKEVVAKAEQK